MTPTTKLLEIARAVQSGAAEPGTLRHAVGADAIIALVEQRDALLGALKLAESGLDFFTSHAAGGLTPRTRSINDQALAQIRAGIALCEPTETQVTR